MSDVGLRERLTEMGANDAQLKSKVVAMMEDALTDEAVSSTATAREVIASLARDVDEAERRMAEVDRRMCATAKMAEEYDAKLRLADQRLSERVVTDEAVRNGLAAYRTMLESTLEVFGEERMTGEVVCKAIEAASYGMWRTVMGPKEKDGRSSLRTSVAYL